MKRRNLLVSSSLLIQALTLPRSPAGADSTRVRAAIVIGIDHYEELPPLNGSRSSGEQFANWLEAEGFAYVTRIFSSNNHPVRLAEIKAAARRFLDLRTIDQLVVYFSGHGCTIARSEFWLLSGAPDDAGEAIVVNEAIDQAQHIGVPNVVFISDACRSTVDSLRAQSVKGDLLFPNRFIDPIDFDPKVDQFYATAVGKAAHEVSETSSQYEAIYTSVFLDAFRNPDSEMILKLSDGVLVVPNRKLEHFLSREVPKRARAKGIFFGQNPQSIVPSSDETFIGRVITILPEATTSPVEPTLSDVASTALAKFSNRDSIVRSQFSADRLNKAAVEFGFIATREAILGASEASQNSRISTGFTVSGTAVKAVVAGDGAEAEILSTQPMTVVRVELQRPAATVALQFEDGSGTVISCLHEYVGHIIVENGLIGTINYDRGGEPSNEFIRQLRATVATAANLSVFRIEGEGQERRRRAEDFGNTIRMGKFADPTLGLYAAYAYNEAGLISSIESVAEIMRGNLMAVLFDVTMLAGEINGRELPHDAVPQCPMLSQGWNLLRVRNVILSELYEGTRAHLLPALWTMFDGPGIESIMNALQQGRLR